MNRNLIALGVAAAVALPLSAQAAPKVYGKLNLSVESYEKEFENPATKADEYSRLQSNASRFGLSGEDELTATLSAVYQIEWEVAADDGNGVTAGKGTDLAQRNRFLGLKSQQFGTLKLGKYDSYTKLAQGEVDLFNDYEGDMKFVIAGENRLDNTIGYESPAFAGFSFNVQTQTQEASSANATQTARKNGSSASIVYKNEELGLYAALAADKSLVSSTALFGTRESDNLRAVVSYKIADLTLNGIYQTSEASAPGVTADEEAGWQLGAAFKLGDETLKAQYGVAEADESTASVQEHSQWSVGVDHNFTSKTKAFLFYTEKEEDKLAALSDYTLKVAAIGLDHKF